MGPGQTLQRPLINPAEGGYLPVGQLMGGDLRRWFC